jgi:predicted metal-binding protein
MSAARTPKAIEPSWDALLLVCKTCRKRSNGPEDVKAKDLALQLRKSMKSRGVKTRVVLTSCQGLCPKGATSVTAVRRAGGAQMFALGSIEEADALAI